MRRALAYLLFLANTNPGAERQAFYAMKGKILRRYGRRVGEDVQELKYDCWTCNSAGGWYSQVTTSTPMFGELVGWQWHECYKCGGDAVYQRRYVALDRWELGGRTFHNPSASLPRRPERVTIHGRVRHPDMGWRATVAKWVLFCWFQPGFVRHEVGYWLRGQVRRYEWWKNDVIRWRDPEGYLRNHDEIPF